MLETPLMNTGIKLPETPYAHMLASQAEMASFDAKTIAAGYASIDLMENAGEAVFSQLKERFSFELYSNGRIVVLCGPGNNGGDGIVIARYLHEHAYDVLAVVSSAKSYSVDFQTQLQSLVDKKGRVSIFPEAAGEALPLPLEKISEEELSTHLKQSVVIVDALLGTGQKDAPRGGVRTIVEVLRRSLESAEHRAKILSVDIPTGVNADSGAVYEPAIQADITICIELIKRGLIQYPARAYAGELSVVSIGIDCSEGTEISLLDMSIVQGIVSRRPDAHKGSLGRVFVVGGSSEMPGAPHLSAHAALRSGAGLVIKSDLSQSPENVSVPELMHLRVKSKTCYGPEDFACLEEMLRKSQCVVLGPGLGTAKQTSEFVHKFIEAAQKGSIPLVIDADALNLLAQSYPRAEGLSLPNCILTPHPGEMGRLLGLETKAVQDDRYAAARTLHERCGATVVLKGAASITYTNGRGIVNSSGNAYMATPGSGDVLCGIIAAFVAQGIALPVAATVAVCVHGIAGDLAHAVHAGPIIASDIIEKIPHALGRGAES